MANFRDINGASRNLNRVTDINLEPENRSALEADIVGAIASLKDVITDLKQPTTHDNDELTRLREENVRLKALTNA